MKMKAEFRKFAGGDAEIRLFGEISWWSECSAERFAATLDNLDTDHITLKVNSPGGDVYDGIAIMNMLRHHQATVTALVEGVAASAASIIVVGGADEVVMSKHSELMIHEPWTFTDGSADDFTRTAAELDRVGAKLARIYAEKAGGGEERWRDAMREETWFSDEEAVACGLADRVEFTDADVEDLVAAKTDTKIMARYRYHGRNEAPKPSVLVAASRKKENMDVLDELCRRLGINNTQDPTVALAALDEALEERAEVEANPTPEETEEVIKTPDTPEDQAPTTEPTPAEDEAPAEDEEDDDDTVIQISKPVYEDLLRRAELGDTLASTTAHQRAEELIETEGVQAGRLLGWQKEKWVNLAVDNYDDTRRALLKLAPGLINMKEKGRGGSAESDPNKIHAALDEAAKRAGLFN